MRKGKDPDPYIQIREAQKHADPAKPDPVPDPDPSPTLVYTVVAVVLEELNQPNQELFFRPSSRSFRSFSCLTYRENKQLIKTKAVLLSTSRLFLSFMYNYVHGSSGLLQNT
jgi:hypothetical protein